VYEKDHMTNEYTGEDKMEEHWGVIRPVCH